MGDSELERKESKAQRYARLELAAIQARPPTWSAGPGNFVTVFSISTDGMLLMENDKFRDLISPEKAKVLIQWLKEMFDE